MADTAAELIVDVSARESVTAVLTRLEAQLGQTNSVAERLATSLESRLGSSQGKAKSDALALAQAQARLQSASGDTAGAIRTLQAALDGVDRSSVAAIRAETQLIQTQNKLARELQGSNQFVDAFKQGLFGFVAPAAAAGTALSVLQGTAQSFVEAFNFKAQMDATTTSVNLQLKGVRDASQVWSEANQFGKAYAFTQAEMNGVVQASVGILRTSQSSFTDLAGVLARMQVLAPGKTIEDAAFSVRELASGDITSIAEQFSISRTQAYAMRDAIAGGADVVQVMKQYLDGAGVGMDTLAARTQGAVGSMNELKQAQEDLKLAQAEWAQGPGLLILQGQIRVTSGLTRILSGDFSAMTSSVAQSSNATAQAIFDWLNAMTGFVPAQQAATAATEQHAVAALQSADAEDRRATSTAAAAAGLDASAVALADQAQKSLDAAASAQQLAQFQDQLASLGGAVAGGLSTASEAAVTLANQYHIAYDAALKLIQAQAALAQAKNAAAALADQRAGERSPGSSGAAEAAAQEERRLQALYRKLQDAPDKAPKGRKGGGGGRGGGTKLSDQQKLNNQLLANEDKANQQFEDEDLKHATALLKIQTDYAKKRLAAEQSLQQSLLDGGASFYDTLINMENQGAAQAADAQYQAFLANDLPAIAADKGADVAEAYQQAYEKVLLDRAKRQAEIEKATKEGDSGRAEALKGVDAKYRQAEEARLARIKEGNGSIASEQAQALQDENLRYEEAQGKIADSADRAAERKIVASQRAGQAIDAEQAKLDRLAATYDRIAPAGGGATGAASGAPAPAPTPVPTAPAPAATGAQAVHDEGVAGAVAALRDAIERVERAVKDGAGRVASAVGSRGGIS